MKQYIHIVIILLLSAAASASEYNENLEYHFEQSMRIENYHVEIFFNRDKNIIYITEQNMDGPKKKSHISLNKEHINTLNKLQNNIVWGAIEKPPIPGLDGHTWTIKTKNNQLSVWVPSYNTSERGLADILALGKYLLKISGFDDDALPLK